MNNSRKLLTICKRYNRIIVVPHKFPDPDAIVFTSPQAARSRPCGRPPTPTSGRVNTSDPADSSRSEVLLYGSGRPGRRRVEPTPSSSGRSRRSAPLSTTISIRRAFTPETEDFRRSGRAQAGRREDQEGRPGQLERTTNQRGKNDQ